MTRGEGQPRASSCLTVSLRLSHLSYLPLEHTLLHPKFPTALLAAEVGPTSPPPRFLGPSGLQPVLWTHEEAAVAPQGMAGFDLWL